MLITKEQFLAYEVVRELGLTNMYDSAVVEQLSGLNRTQQITIMKNYNELCAKYLEGGEDE